MIVNELKAQKERKLAESAKIAADKMAADKAAEQKAEAQIKLEEDAEAEAKLAAVEQRNPEEAAELAKEMREKQAKEDAEEAKEAKVDALFRSEMEDRLELELVTEESGCYRSVTGWLLAVPLVEAAGSATGKMLAKALAVPLAVPPAVRTIL